MSAETLQTWEYVLGEPHPNTKSTATFETKPPSYDNKGRYNSGSGYEHWRSYEERPHTARQGKEDCYASHHRLLAVAWCYPVDMSVSEILDDMHGRDIHHNAPELDWEGGHPFDNREGVLEVIDHGEHSSVTQSQMRAWGEDAKREVEDDTPDADRCVRCDVTLEDVKLTSADWEGPACKECAKVLNDDAPIEVSGV